MIMTDQEIRVRVRELGFKPEQVRRWVNGEFPVAHYRRNRDGHRTVLVNIGSRSVTNDQEPIYLTFSTLTELDEAVIYAQLLRYNDV